MNTRSRSRSFRFGSTSSEGPTWKVMLSVEIWRESKYCDRQLPPTCCTPHMCAGIPQREKHRRYAKTRLQRAALGPNECSHVLVARGIRAHAPFSHGCTRGGSASTRLQRRSGPESSARTSTFFVATGSVQLLTRDLRCSFYGISRRSHGPWIPHTFMRGHVQSEVKALERRTVTSDGYLAVGLLLLECGRSLTARSLAYRVSPSTGPLRGSTELQPIAACLSRWTPRSPADEPSVAPRAEINDDVACTNRSRCSQPAEDAADVGRHVRSLDSM